MDANIFIVETMGHAELMDWIQKTPLTEVMCNRSGCGVREDRARPLSLCGSCGRTLYCSKHCQTQDFKHHKIMCDQYLKQVKRILVSATEVQTQCEQLEWTWEMRSSVLAPEQNRYMPMNWPCTCLTAKWQRMLARITLGFCGNPDCCYRIEDVNDANAMHLSVVMNMYCKATPSRYNRDHHSLLVSFCSADCFRIYEEVLVTETFIERMERLFLRTLPMERYNLLLLDKDKQQQPQPSMSSFKKNSRHHHHHHHHVYPSEFFKHHGGILCTHVWFRCHEQYRKPHTRKAVLLVVENLYRVCFNMNEPIRSFQNYLLFQHCFSEDPQFLTYSLGLVIDGTELGFLPNHPRIQDTIHTLWSQCSDTIFDFPLLWISTTKDNNIEVLPIPQFPSQFSCSLYEFLVLHHQEYSQQKFKLQSKESHAWQLFHRQMQSQEWKKNPESMTVTADAQVQKLVLDSLAGVEWRVRLRQFHQVLTQNTLSPTSRLVTFPGFIFNLLQGFPGELQVATNNILYLDRKQAQFHPLFLDLNQNESQYELELCSLFRSTLHPFQFAIDRVCLVPPRLQPVVTPLSSSSSLLDLDWLKEEVFPSSSSSSSLKPKPKPKPKPKLKKTKPNNKLNKPKPKLQPSSPSSSSNVRCLVYSSQSSFFSYTDPFLSALSEAYQEQSFLFFTTDVQRPRLSAQYKRRKPTLHHTRFFPFPFSSPSFSPLSLTIHFSFSRPRFIQRRKRPLCWPKFVFPCSLSPPPFNRPRMIQRRKRPCRVRFHLFGSQSTPIVLTSRFDPNPNAKEFIPSSSLNIKPTSTSHPSRSILIPSSQMPPYCDKFTSFSSPADRVTWKQPRVVPFIPDRIDSSTPGCWERLHQDQEYKKKRQQFACLYQQVQMLLREYTELLQIFMQSLPLYSPPNSASPTPNPRPFASAHHQSKGIVLQAMGRLQQRIELLEEQKRICELKINDMKEKLAKLTTLNIGMRQTIRLVQTEYDHLTQICWSTS